MQKPRAYEPLTQRYRWDILEYENADLPDPNAEPKEQARELRKAGKELQEIAEATGFSIKTVSLWCQGIDPRAEIKARARKMDEDGMKRKDIAAELEVSHPTIRKWLGKK